MPHIRLYVALDVSNHIDTAIYVTKPLVTQSLNVLTVHAGSRGKSKRPGLGNEKVAVRPIGTAKEPPMVKQSGRSGRDHTTAISSEDGRTARRSGDWLSREEKIATESENHRTAACGRREAKQTQKRTEEQKKKDSGLGAKRGGQRKRLPLSRRLVES